MNINLLMLMELLREFRQKLLELLAVKAKASENLPQYPHVQNHLCRQINTEHPEERPFLKVKLYSSKEFKIKG